MGPAPMGFLEMHYDPAVDGWVLDLGGETVGTPNRPPFYKTYSVSSNTQKQAFIRSCWKSIKKSFRPYKMCCMTVDEGTICSTTGTGSVYESMKSRSMHPVQSSPKDDYYSGMSSEERDRMLKEAIGYCRSRWASSSSQAGALVLPKEIAAEA